MILLDQKNLSATLRRLKNPPTHARIIYKLVSVYPTGYRPDSIHGGIAAMIEKSHLQFVYSYGTLDAAENFIDDREIAPVHLALPTETWDTAFAEEAPALVASSAATPEENLAMAAALKLRTSEYTRRKNIHAAVANLLSAGVAPTAGNPHVHTVVPTKKQADFRDSDADAVFAAHYESVLGTPI